MDSIIWDDLRLMVAVASGGSVRQAGETLGVHASTITRRLERLEHELDVKLFNRNPAGLKLTPAGEMVLEHAKTIAEEIATMRRTVAGEDHRTTGPLSIAVPEGLVEFCIPLIAAFSREHADIALSVETVRPNLDVGSREVDMALVFTEYPPQHLVGRVLSKLKIGAYASAEYLKQHKPHDYAWVAWDAPENDDGHARNVLARDLPIALRVESSALHLQALREGLGIGLLPELVAARSDLHPVRSIKHETAPPLWLLSHVDLRDNARVRAFSSFMVSAFAKNQ